MTSAYFALEGGVFTTLAAGNSAPTYDATNNWVRGAGGRFGGVINSIAFDTTEIGSGDPITCDIGKCVFSMTSSSGGGVPAEWYLDYSIPVAAAPRSPGHYEIGSPRSRFRPRASSSPASCRRAFRPRPAAARLRLTKP